MVQECAMKIRRDSSKKRYLLKVILEDAGQKEYLRYMNVGHGKKYEKA